MFHTTVTLAGETIARNITGPGVMEELARIVGQRGIGRGRLSHPTEVASAVAYFGAPEASFVTGQHIGVSGGMAMILALTARCPSF